MTDAQLLDIWNEFKIKYIDEPDKNYRLQLNADGSGNLTYWDEEYQRRFIDASWETASDACAAIQDEEDSND